MVIITGTSLPTNESGHHIHEISNLSSIETKLDSVITNTGNLKIEAETINLNTDTLETKLQSIDSRLDSSIGHINNMSDIGSGSDQLRACALGAMPSGNGRILSCDVDGKLDVVNSNFAKITTIDTKLDSYAGGGNNNIGEGSTKLQIFNYGRDVANGNYKPMVVNSDAQQIVALGASIPAGDNNIGNVDIASSVALTLNSLPAGDNNIGNVDIVSLPALPAGTNNIGDVDIASCVALTLNALPAGTNNIGDVDIASCVALTLNSLPAGDNNIGNVDIVSLPALPAGTNNIGDVDIASCVALTLNALPAGTNNIGDVDIASCVALTLNALPAGDNNIGNVDIVSLPALPAGTNNIGDVDIASCVAITLNTLPAGDNNIGNVDIVSLPALPAGDNNIGNVDIVSLPALPAGTNNIGDVDIASCVALTLNALPAGDNNIGNVDIVSGGNATARLDIATGAAELADNELSVVADCSAFSEICIAYPTTKTNNQLKLFVKGSTSSGGSYFTFANMVRKEFNATDAGSGDTQHYIWGTGQDQYNAGFIPCVYPFIKIENQSGESFADSDNIRIVGK